jgi:hypothetical protein
MITNTHSLHSKSASCFIKGGTPKETIVIGAGLSRAFGLPLATELLPQMMRWCHANGKSASLQPINRFLTFFYPGYTGTGTYYPLAEDVLGMLDTAEDYQAIRSDSIGYKWRGDSISQIRVRFTKLLAQYLWSFQSELNKSGFSTLEPLRRFVRRNRTRVVYVTFNYDLLLESALSLEGIPYSYRLDPTSACVTVLKPHGSINWFIRTSGKMFTQADWTDFGPHISLFNPLLPETLPFYSSTWKQVAIIAPTPNKEILLPEMKKAWTAFSSAVHAAPSLLSIGYSLPDADRLARLVLQRAGPVHSQSRRITVVNPADVTRVYSQYVSPACTFIKKRFEDFA